MSGLASAVLVVLLALGAAACGSTSGTEVTSLTPRLEAVDAAAVADDPEQLEPAVGRLLRAVDDAEAAGDVSAGHADRIRTAAQALLDAAAPADRRSPKEPTSPPPGTGADADEDDEVEEPRPEKAGPPDKDKGHGKAKPKGKGKPKGHDRDD